MFRTFSNSWILAKECWEVLMHDKEMLVYPVLTTIVNLCILVIAYFYFLAIGFLETEVVFEYSNWQWAAGISLLLATVYACHLSFSFFECALVASALKRLRGENPTLGYGLGIAANRIPQLAGWSLYVTLFGVFVALIKSFIKTKWLQRVIGGMLHTAWNVVTVFVLPLIVVEGLGSTAAIKKSAALLKQKWGEAATLEIGLGAFATIASLPLGLLFTATGLLQESNPNLAFALMIFAIVLGAIIGLVFAALSGIAKAVLFNYAIGDVIPREVHGQILERTVVSGDEAIVKNQTRVQM